MSELRLPFGASPDLSETRDPLAGVAFDAIWEHDLENDTVHWDENLESIFGYRRDEVANYLGWWRECVHPDDLARVEQTAAQALRGDAPGWASEYRFRRKDGSWAWVASRCAIERDAQGRARRAVGVMIDISKLKDTESRLRILAEQIPARACATDRELRVVWDADAAFAANASVVGKTVPELFAQSPDRERVLEGCARALAGESYGLVIDDGTAAHLQLEPFRDPAGNVIGMVGIAFKITDRVRTEEAVRAGKPLLRQVLDTLPVGMIVLDRAGDILLGNSTSRGIWGGSGVERRAMRRDEWASLRALEDGQTIRDELIDIETFDSQRKTIENYAAPIRDAKGAIIGAVVVKDDVTDRVLAEEALRQTERLLVEAEKLGQTGSWEQDLLGGQVFNTEGNRRLFFGDDLRKGTRLKDYLEAIHPDDRGRVLRQRGEQLAGTGPGDIEYRVVWPDGSVHWIFGRATVLRSPSGRLMRTYGTNADITERKRANEELARRTQQLEALSRQLIEAQEAERRAVARELHDDFGQVLTALKLNLQAKGGHGDAESIALVDGAIARMRELAQDLRPPLLDELGLEASLRWYVEREAKRAGLELQLDLEPLPTRASPEVEMTCFRVAQEALTNTIRHAQARRVEVQLRAADRELVLEMRDDGKGFDVAEARHRAAHGGSQGLISMQERVALASGELQMYSKRGRGTAVRIRLPLTMRNAA